MGGQVISAVNLTDGSKYSIGLPYGVCSTAADSVAKTVTVNGGEGFVLEAGAMVIVKFTNANSVAAPTLNVNGTGAKSICRYGTTKVDTETSTSGWEAGAVQTFVYDGTSWIREYWRNSTYANGTLGQGYTVQSNTAQAAAITATLDKYYLTVGGVVALKVNYDVLANSTLNISEKGAKPIWFRGLAIANNIIKAGDVATLIYDGTNYHLLAIDRWGSELENISVDAYMTKSNPTGSGTLTMDGDGVFSGPVEVESLQIKGVTLNYDTSNKFLEFVFTSTTDEGTEDAGEMITFTVEGDGLLDSLEPSVDNGTTWYTFVQEDEYGASFDCWSEDSQVGYGDDYGNRYYLTYNGAAVYGRDVIIDGATYYTTLSEIQGA